VSIYYEREKEVERVCDNHIDTGHNGSFVKILLHNCRSSSKIYIDTNSTRIKDSFASIKLVNEMHAYVAVRITTLKEAQITANTRTMHVYACI